MALITQRALSEALIKLLQDKPLNKITVNDIVSECGVARQTFYYHFQDIYDLLEWTLANDAAELSAKMSESDSWYDRFYVIFSSMKAQKALMTNVFNSLDSFTLYVYITDVTRELFSSIVDPSKADITDRQRTTLIEFYSRVFATILIDWIKHGMKEDAKELLDDISFAITFDMTKLLR